MTVRQASSPITDADLGNAVIQGGDKNMQDKFSPDNKHGPLSFYDAKCRLYPKLSFFFDGTGNNLEIDTPLQRLSNVAKLYNAAIDDRTGKGASTTYISGVGTPFKVKKIMGYTDKLSDDKGGVLGLGLGLGGEMRIQYALAEFSRILEQDWCSASWRCMQFISVSIFGFSRGATGARAFVRRLIKNKCESTERGLVWVAPNGERTLLRIKFMGLFDTVASVGGPALHLDWASQLAIPPEVERCVHYVAAHEVRQAFPLDSVRVDRSYPANCEEVVYPGVHADIGGGYAPHEQGRSDLLARISLRHMFADALRAGVMLQLPKSLRLRIRENYELTDDDPLISLYNDYMSALPAATGNDVESLIQVHRRLNFQWRGMLSRRRIDQRVLGRLYSKINPLACMGEPPATDSDHPTCSPHSWIYEVPPQPETQAKQLLAEQRRLAQQVELLRNPMESLMSNNQWPPPAPRLLTAYEDQMLAAWDDTRMMSSSVDELLSEHVHDSVAHFTSWPCALYDQRSIYCDQSRYIANLRRTRRPGGDTIAA